MATAIMKQKEVPEMDDVEEIISKISKRTWMTVPEMGKLLGLKKTDRYWLVHKNVFESKEIAGKIRINIASFEKWYANQIKYHKVTGEEPGKELKSWSYSVKEVADLLGVDEYLVYELLKKNQMEAVIVDYWKRIPKESFQNWKKTLFWKMQLLRCLRWHSCLEQPEVQYIQFLIIRSIVIFLNSL